MIKPLNQVHSLENNLNTVRNKNTYLYSIDKNIKLKIESPHFNN
jgi:hypothetical protein